MPRPRKCRMIDAVPGVCGFSPRRRTKQEELVISMEGVEAIRFSDREGLSQEEAAEKMKISRQTYGRVLAEARRIVAEALVTGRGLRVDGGSFAVHGDEAVAELDTISKQSLQDDLDDKEEAPMINQQRKQISESAATGGGSDSGAGKTVRQGRGLGRGGGKGRRDGTGGGQGRGGGGYGGRRRQS
jgi:predicted DNA-binding protein (UPF0251 family)